MRTYLALCCVLALAACDQVGFGQVSSRSQMRLEAAASTIPPAPAAGEPDTCWLRTDGGFTQVDCPDQVAQAIMDRNPGAFGERPNN